MDIRHTREADYDKVSAVINEWWGGREMADMLPKLFFIHFSNTSFIAEKEGELVAFLIGFISQSKKGEAYVHFIGVHPSYRKKGLAFDLYNRFFEAVKKKGCSKVRCVTSPVNKNSIAFHKKFGFLVEPGNGKSDGVSVTKNYDGPG
ncbi:GNAT family N-acetyltransferase [Pseudalkalibacillus caeni]|uniref:GNAT family N-acetyltransferase n=1 Tax=Exobacillus caeni TaxID=2574798 RepID=A0A5R9FF82_9BACL|nr:GNAT family N-acetyltransferase [Pseudalkalibacillus caeni]TLS38235.1 GNAT family N-acetyltransferase [Pseudalkalibacillus caeni]